MGRLNLICYADLRKYAAMTLALQVCTGQDRNNTCSMNLTVIGCSLPEMVIVMTVMTSNPYIFLHQLFLLNGWHGNQENVREELNSSSKS